MRTVENMTLNMQDDGLTAGAWAACRESKVEISGVHLNVKAKTQTTMNYQFES